MRRKVGIIALLLTFGYSLQVQSLSVSSEEDDSRENTTQRIVGGYEANIEDFPWQVSIAHKDRHHCGGSIISKSYILTAAHCTYGFNIFKMEIRVGSSYRDKDGLIYKPSAVHQHPQYNNENYHHDISILKVNQDIEFSSTVQPVTLPKPCVSEPEPGTIATVTGFGQLSSKNSTMSSRLMEVDVPIISRETCKELYRKFLVDESMLCTNNPNGGKDACVGDSGGPLMVDNVQFGIVSWGISCASPKHPGVFASVLNSLDFITKTLDHGKN